MMNELGVKDNSDLSFQTQQKINFMTEILNIIQNNVDVLEYATNNPHGMKFDLTPRIITLKEINFHRDYYDDILDYFKDYGMCLYEFLSKEKSKEECLIY